MPTINDTVDTVLRANGQSSYLGYAGPVIAALVEREREISVELIDYAGTAGADTTSVRELLAVLGMALPNAPVNPDDIDDDPDIDGDVAALTDAVNSLTRTVESLVGFARANGYSGN